MNFTSTVLIPSTTVGTPSGNYDGSSLLFYGDAVPAANYYGGERSLQTVTLNLTDFVGVITLQATLNDAVAVGTDQAEWFDTQVYGDSAMATGIYPFSIVGNFTFMRARVADFEAGTINSITIAY